VAPRDTLRYSCDCKKAVWALTLPSVLLNWPRLHQATMFSLNIVSLSIN
jgi:hypothetical protein